MSSKLISVVVIAYNSQNTIIETLESIKKQSHDKIELIVSDDASSDKTVRLAEEWIVTNKHHFTDCKVISVEKNTGITANCNRGILAVSGEYIKLIAADDLLLENCLNDLLEYLTGNQLKIAFSKALPFSDTQDSKHINNIIERDEVVYTQFFKKSQYQQYKSLFLLNIPLSIIVGCFCHRDLFNQYGLYDETYEMMEDYPFLIKISSSGQRFHLLDKYTVKYRVRPIEDFKDHKLSKRFNAHYFNLRNFRKKEVLPRMLGEKMYISYFYLYLVMTIMHLEYEQNNKILLFIARNAKVMKRGISKIKRKILG